MGNSKSPKKSGNPKRVYPNVYTSKEKGKEGSVTPQPDSVTFFLVKISLQVAKNSKINDTVTAHPMDDEIEIHTQSGRIGNVPPSRIDAVRENNFTQGFISKISREGERIQVTLNG